MGEITVTITIHPDGSVTDKQGDDLSGIISALLASDQFIAAVAKRLAEDQQHARLLAASAAVPPMPSQYILPAYNFVETFSGYDIYEELWGLKTQIAAILVRNDVDPADALIMDDKELLSLRLMGAKSLSELKAKRHLITRRALHFEPNKLGKAVRIVLSSGLFDDDENFKVDDVNGTLTVSAIHFRALADLIEQSRLKAEEVVAENVGEKVA